MRYIWLKSDLEWLLFFFLERTNAKNKNKNIIMRWFVTTKKKNALFKIMYCFNNITLTGKMSSGTNFNFKLWDEFFWELKQQKSPANYDNPIQTHSRSVGNLLFSWSRSKSLGRREVKRSQTTCRTKPAWCWMEPAMEKTNAVLR